MELRNETQINKGGLPECMEKYFWDTDIKALDMEKNKVFIIERLLNVGDEKTLDWVFTNYSEDVIRDAVLTSRGLSLKTARCWQNYFKLKEEDMRCFGIFSTGIREEF
jgi:hypothetical protein